MPNEYYLSRSKALQMTVKVIEAFTHVENYGLKILILQTHVLILCVQID